MLTSYEAQTSRLLHDAQHLLFPLADLDYYINVSRLQIALEGEATRYTVAFNSFGGNFLLSSVGLFSGVSSIGVLRRILNTSSGQALSFRPWDWFFEYYLQGSTANTLGPPAFWTQLNHTSFGRVFLFPTDAAALLLDCVLVPILLVDDTTLEVLPWPWVDVVPYLAAYLALLNAQRYQDAETMWELGERMMLRARKILTPSVQPDSWPGCQGTGLVREHMGSLAVPLSQSGPSSKDRSGG